MYNMNCEVSFNFLFFQLPLLSISSSIKLYLIIKDLSALCCHLTIGSGTAGKMVGEEGPGNENGGIDGKVGSDNSGIDGEEGTGDISGREGEE
jgi:hypothetical protein